MCYCVWKETAMSTKELAMTLESYLKKEQEDITKAGPSVKQEVGNVVIKKIFQ